MRSAMVLISLKALSMARSELLMVRRFWYLELPNSSKLAAPVPCGGNVMIFYWENFTAAAFKREATVTEDVVYCGCDTQVLLTL